MSFPIWTWKFILQSCLTCILAVFNCLKPERKTFTIFYTHFGSCWIHYKLLFLSSVRVCNPPTVSHSIFYATIFQHFLQNIVMGERLSCKMGWGEKILKACLGLESSKNLSMSKYSHIKLLESKREQW